MLIDMHIHVAKPRHPKLLRSAGSRYPTPDEALAMMDAAGVDKAVILSTVSPEWRYTVVTPEEMLEVAAQHPDRFIPFCNLDPRYLTNDATANFTPLLEAYKEMGCKGVGEYFPNIPFDDPLNMNLFAHVEKAGLPLTFHIAPKKGGHYGVIDDLGLPRLEKVLRSFPNLILLGHSQPFWAEIHAGAKEDERMDYPKGPVTPGRVVELMRKYPNLCGDLSAGSGFNAISRDPEFGYRFLEEFQDRLYWGTDIAEPGEAMPIVDYFSKLKAEARISRGAYEKITWRNANRLLGLGLE